MLFRSRWEISPDGLTYTFHLRPEGRWSNGDPVTAADFIASYRRLLTPATAAPTGTSSRMVTALAAMLPPPAAA